MLFKCQIFEFDVGPLKIEIMARIWTEFLFRRVLRYFQVRLKNKKYRFVWDTLIYIHF